MMPRHRSTVLFLAATLLVAGCWRGAESSRPPIHINPNMDRQPKLLPQAESTLFYDGGSMQAPLEGTVAREERVDLAFTTGKDAAGAWLATSPQPADAAVLARGADRYAIYCSPCHADNGSGRGILLRYASFQCADLSQERLVTMSDGELFGILRDGVGMMPSFRSRIPAEDRWAIITHVRELQRR